ncbi:MAG: ribosome-binding factor [Hyphomicrobiales bacterium]|nr:ribosome-binding factor [Hyphomicrobiales bacterium]
MSRTHQKGGEPSQRMLRVGELVRHAMSELLTRGALNDAVLDTHVVTVPRVKMSPDLKLATCYVMPLGGGDMDEVLEALDKHRKYLRGEVARKINMKFAPEVRFRIDDTFDNADKIDQLLKSPRVSRDLAADEAQDLGAGEDGARDEGHESGASGGKQA